MLLKQSARSRGRRYIGRSSWPRNWTKPFTNLARILNVGTHGYWTQRRDCSGKSFLFFSGDSRLGKTEFVKQSVEGGVFIATCSKASEPDLRDYEGPPEEKTILYDEASPQMVSDHRDLFQAPRHEVTLGHSDTNCYAYKVKVWQVRMVVCTNNWEEQLNAMQVDKDREWLIKNSVVYNVTEELFRKEDGVLESEAT